MIVSLSHLLLHLTRHIHADVVVCHDYGRRRQGHYILPLIIQNSSAKMKDQPWDLNQTWPVGRKGCRFTHAFKHFGALPPKFGAEKNKFLTTFSRLPHSTPRISGTKCRIDKQKYQCQSTICPLQVDLLSVTFDPETAEIGLLIVTHRSAAITLQPS